MRTAEVVAHEPAMQVVIHLLRRAVALRLGRVLFGQPVHPLHHSIDLGRVRQGRSMLNLLVLTDLIKLMRGRNLGSIAVLEAVERELASVISQNLRDLERIKSQAPRQEICRRLLVLAFIHPKKRQASGAINGHEAVTLFAFKFGQVKTVRMKQSMWTKPGP